jgi:hypothetical protein
VVLVHLADSFMDGCAANAPPDGSRDGESANPVPRRPVRARIAGPTASGGSAMDKKAKTPKKPKQTKSKDGAAKGK